MKEIRVANLGDLLIYGPIVSYLKWEDGIIHSLVTALITTDGVVARLWRCENNEFVNLYETLFKNEHVGTPPLFHSVCEYADNLIDELSEENQI